MQLFLVSHISLTWNAFSDMTTVLVWKLQVVATITANPDLLPSVPYDDIIREGVVGSEYKPCMSLWKCALA